MFSTGSRGRRYGRVLLTGLLFGAVTLVSTDAWAAPASPQPSPGSRPEGPWPPSRVLAVDPATIPVPPASRSASAACPPAADGVNHFAPGAGKTVALTFDDGPGPNTEAVMQILEDNGVAATVAAQKNQGFLLGNHSWSHPDMATLSESAQAADRGASWYLRSTNTAGNATTSFTVTP